MVKEKGNGKRQAKQERKDEIQDKAARITQITAETKYGECSERLTAFGGLLALSIAICYLFYHQSLIYVKNLP